MWRGLDFQRRGLGDSLVQRLERSETLKGHRGCVNTIRWNERGDQIISGSDDCKVISTDCLTCDFIDVCIS
jgi:WD40 repeat protein